MQGLIKNVLVEKRSPSPGPVIGVHLQITQDKRNNLKMMGYTTKVRLCNIMIGDRIRLDTRELEQGASIEYHEEFFINPYLFREIEKVRMGGDVPVNVEIQTLHFVHTNEFNIGNISNSTAYVHQAFKLSEREWLNIASELGYFDYAIFEILRPKVHEIPSLSSAISRLREAQQLFNEGNNKPTVVKCREAFESLREAIALKPEIIEKIDYNSPGQKEKPKKSERIDELQHKIYNLLHTGAHEGYDITREDAGYILFLSFSTIQYYSSQFTKL
ncbi:MAG: hypothetical protein JSW00_11060 [Thermoplasmata archaeon]|nr:MAG: hypothetical protein JSW00_11060 [Thermoplasmata archaeon]